MPESFVIDASGMDPITGDWREIDSRENSTMVSTWTERLCLRRTDHVFELAVCINAGLAEDPGRDEDDNDGAILNDPAEPKLPAFYDGNPVAGVEDGILCGPLRVSPDDDGAIELAVLNPTSATSALRRLGWDATAEIIAQILKSATDLGERAASALPRDLVEAYLETQYHTNWPAYPFDLTVGRPSEPLLALYRSMRRRSAAYVTAWNPYGEPLPNSENARRHARLLTDASHLELPYFEGEGRGRDTRWPPEKSVLVLGLSFEGALQLGRDYDQNAIVWADADAVPQLVLLR